jgi:hypothetical protein
MATDGVGRESHEGGDWNVFYLDLHGLKGVGGPPPRRAAIPAPRRPGASGGGSRRLLIGRGLGRR